MAVYQADALVIRSREFGESDKILTLFSRELGKLQAVAKGVRKPKSRQRAGAQLFTYADFLIHKGKTLDTVSQCSPRESFSDLWFDFERSFAAFGMAELLDMATVPAQPNEELFRLTLTCFFLLEQLDSALVLSAYTLRVMTLLGYRPHLGKCAECGAEVGGERLFFSPEAGGTLCERCRGKNVGRWVQRGSVAFMGRLRQTDLTKINRLRWSARMEQEIMETLQYFAEYKLEGALKSWRMRRLKAPDLGHNESGEGGKEYD